VTERLFCERSPIHYPRNVCSIHRSDSGRVQEIHQRPVFARNLP
jgi:hypothetical protein